MRNPEVADHSDQDTSLSALERKCLELTATGMDPTAIGPVARITPREVEILLFCAMRKLGAANTMQAVAKYLASNTVETKLV